MKLSEMVKDMKRKRSVSCPPTKNCRTFFVKKVFMGGQTIFGKFMGGCFTWGLMIRSWKGGS